MALKYAQDYFNSCGVTSYHLDQEQIVGAQFLSIYQKIEEHAAYV